MRASKLPPEIRDVYQELANVSMGQAADLLARLLNAFVVLPIPNVNVLEVSELHMALSAAADSDTLSAVCQGFIGAGIAGEALILFHDSSFKDLAKLMNHQGTLDRTAELELLMDTANVLIGAFLRGYANQLDTPLQSGSSSGTRSAQTHQRADQHQQKSLAPHPRYRDQLPDPGLRGTV